MDDSDIYILIGLARIAPDTTAAVELADWADVVRRAAALAPGRPSSAPASAPALASILGRGQPVADSLGWGTRPLREAAAATRRPVDAGSEFHGWGTRRF